MLLLTLSLDPLCASVLELDLNPVLEVELFVAMEGNFLFVFVSKNF